MQATLSSSGSQRALTGSGSQPLLQRAQQLAALQRPVSTKLTMCTADAEVCRAGSEGLSWQKVMEQIQVRSSLLPVSHADLPDMPKPVRAVLEQHELRWQKTAVQAVTVVCVCSLHKVGRRSNDMDCTLAFPRLL